MVQVALFILCAASGLVVTSRFKQQRMENFRVAVAILLAGSIAGVGFYGGMEHVQEEALDAGHAELVDGEFRWLPVGDVAGGGE